jgi:SAM-dependent methyltransferase
MEEFRDYKRYVSDPDWARTYSAYQKKYEVNPRESDRKSARLVLAALRDMAELDRPPRILDIGCSTGNFLRHLRRLVPHAEFVGGDLMAPIVEECRNNPELAGIAFEVMDIFDIPAELPFDVIVANAVTYLFEPTEFERVNASFAKALNTGGVYVGYELIFPGDREKRVIEKSQGHPEGLKMILRAEDFVRSSFVAAGFDDVDVQPFDIPIDLPKPEATGTDADLMTYTVRDAVTGRRLMYRGDLFQPWAHVVARKASRAGS